jgi:hypothetical protein
MQLLRGSVCVAIVAAGCVSSWAQTWTYQGSNICYQSMCFSQGTLTSAAGGLLQSQVSQQSWQQQQNANQAGAAVGSLIGTLIAGWIHHHQQVKSEEKALKLELLKYVDAKIEVLQEMKKLHQDSAQQVLDLKQLDPSHRDSWEAVQKSMDEVIALDDKMIQLNVDYRGNVEKNFRTKKGLDYALNDKEAGAKNLYASALNLAAVAYVMNQFYRAVLGYIKSTMQVTRLCIRYLPFRRVFRVARRIPPVDPDDMKPKRSQNIVAAFSC